MQDKGFSWVDFLAYAVDDVDVDVDAPSVDDALSPSPRIYLRFYPVKVVRGGREGPYSNMPTF